MDKRMFIAKNVASLFQDGDLVNLGIGIPTLASGFIPEGMTVLFHAENGCVGCDKNYGMHYDHSQTREEISAWLKRTGGEEGSWETEHKDLCNAGGESISLIPGAACFNSNIAFGIARGGHLDATVLGALQVDRECNLANWKIPGKKLNGMGGAMDIVSGAKKVIIAMEHCAKNGTPKIVEHCTLPLTAVNCVDMIVTDLCMIECQPGKLTVVAMAPNVTKEEIISKTGTELVFADDMREMLC